MKIRLLTLMAGPAGSAAPGQVLDLPAGQARPLLEGGYAELAERVEPVQTAALEAPEAAVTRRRRPNGRAARPGS